MEVKGISVEYFPGRLASVLHKRIENSHGIYAWYYHPKIRKNDVSNIVDQWFGESLTKKQIEANIQIWIIEKFYSKYDLFLKSEKFETNIFNQEEVVPIHKSKKMSHRIQIAQTIKWKPVFSKSLISRLAANKTVARNFVDELNGLHAFFPPIYIGQARGKTGIQGRLKSHYEKLVKFAEMSSEDLKGMIDEDLSEPNTDSFARRAAYCEISPDDLWFTYKIIENGSETDLENFLNRLVYPGLGSL